LLNPLGYKHLKVWRTFLAVMSGYFVNLLLPRAGEITRCGILRNNEGVPMSSSIGSVIAERVFDLIILISLIVITFFLQIDILGNFLSKFFGEKYDSVSSNAPILFAAGAVALTLLILVIYLVKKHKAFLSRMPLFNKVVNFIKELLNGAMSIRRLENQVGFWTSTIFIWLLYFLMAYVVFFGIPATSHLGILAGLSVLVMGGLGMSAPVQGGIGAYHLLVGGVLVLYGIEKEDGVFFALILHTSQFLSVLFFGGISLIVAIFQKKAQRKKYPMERTN
jgi:uncharacterized protein (TIRG00374 family)